MKKTYENVKRRSITFSAILVFIVLILLISFVLVFLLDKNPKLRNALNINDDTKIENKIELNLTPEQKQLLCSSNNIPRPMLMFDISDSALNEADKMTPMDEYFIFELLDGSNQTISLEYKIIEDEIYFVDNEAQKINIVDNMILRANAAKAYEDNFDTQYIDFVLMNKKNVMIFGNDRVKRDEQGYPIEQDYRIDSGMKVYHIENYKVGDTMGGFVIDEIDLGNKGDEDKNIIKFTGDFEITSDLHYGFGFYRGAVLDFDFFIQEHYNDFPEFRVELLPQHTGDPESSYDLLVPWLEDTTMYNLYSDDFDVHKYIYENLSEKNAGLVDKMTPRPSSEDIDVKAKIKAKSFTVEMTNEYYSLDKFWIEVEKIEIVEGGRQINNKANMEKAEEIQNPKMYSSYANMIEYDEKTNIAKFDYFNRLFGYDRVDALVKYDGFDRDEAEELIEEAWGDHEFYAENNNPQLRMVDLSKVNLKICLNGITSDTYTDIPRGVDIEEFNKVYSNNSKLFKEELFYYIEVDENGNVLEVEQQYSP